MIKNVILKNNLPVKDNEGAIIANLVPISSIDHDLSHVAKLLSKWRNDNRNCFLTEFTVTEESTLNWIKNFWLASNHQELFLVEIENKFVGHFGFKNLTKNSVLLDNAIRGETGGEAKLFFYVGMTLIEWIFSNTEVQIIDGSIFCDNIPAIMLNRQLGFQGWEKIYLKKVIVEDKIIYEKLDQPNEYDQLRSMYNIHLNRESWMSKRGMNE